MAKTSRVSLENVLLREKFITDKGIEKAEHYQKNNGGNLSEIFVKLGLVTEEQVVIRLAKQLGIPHMKLTNYKLNSEIVEIVPAQFQKEYRQ